MDVMRRPPCSSDDRPTSALRSSPSLFRTGTGVHDAGTHEGLRAALAEIGSQGWDSEAGRAVMYSLTSRCAGWSAKMSRNPGAGGGAADPGDVLSLAWLTLDRFARNVAAADAPWAYLWTAVGRAMAVDAAAAAMLSERAVRRARSNWPVGVHRLGADDVRVGPTAGLDGTAPGLVTVRGEATAPRSRCCSRCTATPPRALRTSSERSTGSRSSSRGGTPQRGLCRTSRPPDGCRGRGVCAPACVPWRNSHAGRLW